MTVSRDQLGKKSARLTIAQQKSNEIINALLNTVIKIDETGHLPIWKEVKFIDRDPHWYTRRVKEAIHIRLHPNNINRDSGIEIPEAWIPTIRKHNSRPTTKRTCEGTTSNRWNNNEDRNAPIAANHHATNSDT